MILYTTGCSHTAGSNAEWTNLHGDYSLSWPNQLAQTIGYELVDDSKPGHSNGYMLRKLTEYLMDGNIPDKVVIQWTNPLRVDLPMPDGSFQTSITTGETWPPIKIDPWVFTSEPHIFRAGWRLLATQAHQAITLLDKYGIEDYMFIFWRFDYEEFPHLDQIDESKVITNAGTLLRQEGFRSVYEMYGTLRPGKMGTYRPDPHFGADAQVQIAHWIANGMSDKEFLRHREMGEIIDEVYTGEK